MSEPRRASRRAVLEAASELLVTRGVVGVSEEAVAERARVSAATIRRWWPSEEALVMDALHHEWHAMARHIRGAGCRLGL